MIHNTTIQLKKPSAVDRTVHLKTRPTSQKDGQSSCKSTPTRGGTVTIGITCSTNNFQTILKKNHAIVDK